MVAFEGEQGEGDEHLGEPEAVGDAAVARHSADA